MITRRLCALVTASKDFTTFTFNLRKNESGAGLIPGYAYSAPSEDLKLKK
jgi:hypothetical protein